MSLFKKRGKAAEEMPLEDSLPDFVDALLAEADLDNMEETDPLTALSKTHYGIDQAIELMEKLPKDNNDLVVSVVKATLASANVDVDAVIADAQNKVESIQQQITRLGEETVELKSLIARKQTETAEAQAALNQTLLVKELLQQSADAVAYPIAVISKPQSVPPSVARTSLEETDKPHKKSQIA